MDGITDSMDMSLSTLGDSEGQRSLVCCSPWGHRVRDNRATGTAKFFKVYLKESLMNIASEKMSLYGG